MGKENGGVQGEGMEVPIRLRGHHALCIFGFRGFGYNDEFTAGMAEVVRRLRRPGAAIAITAGPDDICAHCPSRDTSASCKDPENARDRAVLSTLGVAVGDTMLPSRLTDSVIAHVTPARFAELCDGCPWYHYGMCAKGIRMGRIAAGWEETPNDIVMAEVDRGVDGHGNATTDITSGA